MTVPSLSWTRPDVLDGAEAGFREAAAVTDRTVLTEASGEPEFRAVLANIAGARRALFRANATFESEAARVGAPLEASLVEGRSKQLAALARFEKEVRVELWPRVIEHGAALSAAARTAPQEERVRLYEAALGFQTRWRDEFMGAFARMAQSGEPDTSGAPQAYRASMQASIDALKTEMVGAATDRPAGPP